MTARPSEITGSPGSKIRVLLGASGDDYLYFLEEDYGSHQHQSREWTCGPGSLPDGLAAQLNNMSAKGRYVTDVAFGPGDEWFVSGRKRDGSGAHSWWGSAGSASEGIKEWCGSSHRLQVQFGPYDQWALIQGNNSPGHWFSHNVDEALVDRVKRLNQKRKSFNFLRLLPFNAYFISDGEGTEWKTSNEYLSKELKSGGGGQIFDVAMARDGDWLIIRAERFVSSTGISSELTSRLARFYRDHRARQQERAAEIRAYDERLERERREKEQAERERQEKETREREEALAAEKRRREREREAREREARRDTRRISEVASGVDVLQSTIRDQQAQLRNRHVELYALTERQFLWRGLRDGESWQTGLYAQDMTADVSLYTAIAEGSRPSQFVHTSLEAETAVYYAAALNSRVSPTVVQIDRSKLPEADVFDVSDSAKFQREMPSHYSTNSPTHHFACAHKVVIIRGSVPRDAIVGTFIVPSGVPRGLSSGTSLASYNEMLSRCAAANAIEEWKFDGALKIFLDVLHASQAKYGIQQRYHPSHVRAAATAVRVLKPGTASSPWNDNKVRE